MADDYTTIRCRVKLVYENSVWITTGAGAQRDFNIPRSLIHGADETRLDSLLPGTPLELRLFTWKAQEFGLDGKDDKTGDLFGAKA